MLNQSLIYEGVVVAHESDSISVAVPPSGPTDPSSFKIMPTPTGILRSGGYDIDVVKLPWVVSHGEGVVAFGTHVKMTIEFEAAP